jgi:hypothetical protein
MKHAQEQDEIVIEQSSNKIQKIDDSSKDFPPPAAWWASIPQYAIKTLSDAPEEEQTLIFSVYEYAKWRQLTRDEKNNVYEPTDDGGSKHKCTLQELIDLACRSMFDVPRFKMEALRRICLLLSSLQDSRFPLIQAFPTPIGIAAISEETKNPDVTIVTEQDKLLESKQEPQAIPEVTVDNDLPIVFEIVEPQVCRRRKNPEEPECASCGA